MPHITVDYSNTISESFDRRAFAEALNHLTAKVIDTRVDRCKTRLRRIEEAVLGDGAPGHAMIYIELAILSGRTAESKAELTEAVLALAREHTASVPGLTVGISAYVTDLDPAWYRSAAE
jgi:5-carboxymethyl-2-hydroxymuconate isomerase